MKFVLTFITFMVIQGAFTQYDGREYNFHSNKVSKSDIDEAIRFVMLKADSIKVLTEFEGNLQINIVSYQKSTTLDHEWNCFVGKLSKRIEKVYGTKPHIIISDRTPDNLPVSDSYVSISPIWQ